MIPRCAAVAHPRAERYAGAVPRLHDRMVPTRYPSARAATVGKRQDATRWAESGPIGDTDDGSA